VPEGLEDGGPGELSRSFPSCPLFPSRAYFLPLSQINLPLLFRILSSNYPGSSPPSTQTSSTNDKLRRPPSNLPRSTASISDSTTSVRHRLQHTKTNFIRSIEIISSDSRYEFLLHLSFDSREAEAHDASLLLPLLPSLPSLISPRPLMKSRRTCQKRLTRTTRSVDKRVSRSRRVSRFVSLRFAFCLSSSSSLQQASIKSTTP